MFAVVFGYFIGVTGVLWVAFVVVTSFLIAVELLLLVHKRLKPYIELRLSEGTV